MRVALFALAFIFASESAAAAPQTASAFGTVRQFVDALDKGDIKTAVATCATPSSIIDDFPPHMWQGPTACADWANAFEADSKKEGITDSVVTLGKPWHVNVTADRAYVVVPATYTYQQHGKRVTESGSIFTVALRKFVQGWRITGWTWAEH